MKHYKSLNILYFTFNVVFLISLIGCGTGLGPTATTPTDGSSTGSSSSEGSSGVGSLSVSVGGTTLTSASYSFGIIPESLIAEPTTFTLTNGGTADVTVSGVTVTSSNSLFSVGSVPTTVSAQSTATFTATFDPTTSSDSTLSSTITVTSDAEESGTIAIAASGTTKWLGSFIDGNAATGLNKNTGDGATGLVFANFNSKMYAAWNELTGGIYQVRVAVYNGNDSAPSWAFVDGNSATAGMNKDSARHGRYPHLAVFNDKLYITWFERDSGANQENIRVAVYSGSDSAPTWTMVDGNNVTGLNYDVTDGAAFSKLTVFNNKLYVNWIEYRGTSYRFHVRVFNGSDTAPSWTFVDGNSYAGLNYIETKNATNQRLTVFDGKLYASWNEQNASNVYQVRIKVYNGNDSSPSWSTAGGTATTGINYDTSQTGMLPHLVSFNSKLYATWYESNGVKWQVRAAVYNGNDAAPSWTMIDGNAATGLNYDTSQGAALSSWVVFCDRLYLIWQEGYGAGEVQQIRFAAYGGNDSSPSWAFADGNAATGLNKDITKGAQMPSMIAIGSKLYAGWYEPAAGIDQIRVRAAMPAQ